jgi:sporulation protein YlmC with PRC-barrel domain
MSEVAAYVIGAPVSCQDGECGELVRVLVDPVKRAVTHLVVKRRHGHDVGRLVPVHLAQAATGREVRLTCTQDELEALDYAKETEFVPMPGGQWDIGLNPGLLMPDFGPEDTDGMGQGGPGRLVAGGEHDRVPPGEVEIQRAQRVYASDGAIGHVRGLVVDPGDNQVTHVLLDEGHLWGKKEVSIPVSAVTGVDDGVRLNLTKGEVADLPAVEL